jgi:hypothetical protein
LLALATGRDGANRNYTVAVAFFPVESQDNWQWFCQQMKRGKDMDSILNP